MDIFALVRPASLLLTLAAVAALPPGDTGAQGLPRPRATVGTTKVEFLPPLGMWRADTHSVAMIFPSTPVSPAVEAEARRDATWPFEGIGPVAKVELTFASGKYSAALGELEGCWIGLYGFRGEPIEISGNAAQCHLLSTGGRLQPGGMLIGLIEGKGRGYDLRLPFTVMFPAAATTATAVAAPPPVAPAAPALPPIALNSVSGTGAFTGQTLRFTHGLAWIGPNGLEVALFDHAPRAGLLAELRTGSWGEGGPTATMTFTPGTSGPAGITHCYVNLDFPKGGPMGLNVNSAADCGLTELSGTVRAGGNVVARLAGSAPMRDRQPMTWDLRFNLPLPK